MIGRIMLLVCFLVSVIDIIYGYDLKAIYFGLMAIFFLILEK